MDFITGLIVGAVVGLIVALFIVGAAKQNHEYDSYMEGFNDGQNATRYTSVTAAEFPIKEEKE